VRQVRNWRFIWTKRKKILIDYMRRGARWICAPKPRLHDESFDVEDTTGHALREIEPMFDAANVLRMGKDLLYLVSDSGNELGCKWLQSIVGPTYRVHPCNNLYTGMHIDTTLCLLRPGLALINPSRVTKDNMPWPLRNWDTIQAPPMLTVSYSDRPPISSEWIGMNLLMLNPHLAVVDKHQTALIRLLEKNRIDVIPLVLRHGVSLGGSYHCITLDVRRRGKLEDYLT
jgi:N-dimethylarginine dimethylaminohydrolase